MEHFLNEDQTKKIINHFGAAFYNKVLKDIEVYTDRWQLSRLQFIPSYSVNCIFKCHSKLYGDTVLKIGNPCRQMFTEFHALKEYDGRHYCQVYDADLENGIILEEQIIPGSTLWEVASLEGRLAIFCSLFRDLYITQVDTEIYPITPFDTGAYPITAVDTGAYPITAVDTGIYPSYLDSIREAADFVYQRPEYSELSTFMKKAEELCSELTSIYNGRPLLHGDLHQENILLGSQGEYKIIDPKGVVGDPVFDIGQFVINEFDEIITADTYKKICTVIDILGNNLNIPKDTLRKCIYIQTILDLCWDAEEGGMPSLERAYFTADILDQAMDF